MKLTGWLTIGGIWLLACAASVQAQSGKINYAEYDRLLRTYVDGRGLVNYAGLKRELPALKSLVDQIGATGPENRPDLFPDDGERLRYYMTAYNAWVLYYAAAAYPAKNEFWNFLGLFRNHDIQLGGRRSTLEDLEHKIIRKQFQDPRIHFYINCAAASCPALWQGAIPEGKTDEVLERSARRFINDTKHVRYEAASRRLYLSKIFDWFAADFLNYLKQKRGLPQPHIAQYLLLYLEGPARASLEKTPLSELSVRYLSYDKSLNEQK
jgi:hypothetical protein